MKLLISLVMVAGLLFPFSVISASASEKISSDTLLIMQVQTGGVGSSAASEEYILLYNDSKIDIKITNWCVEYSSAADNLGFKSCIVPPDSATDIFVLADGYVTFATPSFVTKNPGLTPDVVFTGGMNATSGHVRIRDASRNEIDKVGWGAAVNPEKASAIAHGSGEVLSRNSEATILDTGDNSVDFSSRPILGNIESGLYEQEIVIDLCANIAGVQTSPPAGMLVDEAGNCFEDYCPNISGLQLTVPEGYEKLLLSDECTLIPLEDSLLYITELYPNAPGTDAGQEFIEVFNPNNSSVNMKGYSVQVGPAFSTKYVFEDLELAPKKYMHFSDTFTGIVLPNSTGVQLRLISPAGRIVSETPVYADAKDNESWSLINGSWEYTTQITPSAENKSSPKNVEVVASATTSLQPCPAGKFRNPATNRCKNIEAATGSLVPCDNDEFRNPLTNRCNKIKSSTSSLTPCKPGQVRNSETNRCRNSNSTSSTLIPCKPGQVRNPATNRCRSVVAAGSELKPCEEGKERNPETNRCRKVATLSSANGSTLGSVTDIPVKSSEGQVNWGIITLAILGTAGYMLYEWRSELQQKLAHARQSSWRQ